MTMDEILIRPFLVWENPIKAFFGMEVNSRFVLKGAPHKRGPWKCMFH